MTVILGKWKLVNILLDAHDRKLAEQLQKRLRTTFSEVMRRALRQMAAAEGVKTNVA